MEIAVGAIGPLLSKLTSLLVGEFTLEKRMRKGIKSLLTELMRMEATLDKVASVPPGQLDKGVNIWVGIVRDLSYQMENIVDASMLHVKDAGEPASPKKMHVKKLLKKTTRLFKKDKDLHRISDALEEAVAQCKQLAELHQRYKLEIRGAGSDPPLMALYTDVGELIGIEDPRDKLINMLLTEGDDWLKHPLKTVSIVGFGGLGKTTLAKAAYDEIKGQFDCGSFVSVSQNPDMKKVFQNILYELDKNKYADVHIQVWQEKHLIDKLITFLNGKRYLIVIDNIWDESLWEIIRSAFPNNNNLGSRIITTTRIISVSKACCSSANDSVYQMEPLSADDSNKLLYARIFDYLGIYPPEFEQVSNDILEKCGGVPVAIVAMASVLARYPQMKTKDQMNALLKSIGHGFLENSNMADMQRILWLSYSDLPPHLRICLLYLSTFPGTHPIEKHRLVKKLIAEGKVTREMKLIGTPNKKEAKLSQELSLEEAASQYLNELVNRNVIHPLECNNNGEVITYHIHPMMHDFLKAIAKKEEFAASLDVKDISGLLRNPHGMKFRHLSINCPDSKSQTDLSRMAFDGRVKSLTFFGHANRILLRHCKVIWVLDLGGCQSIERADVEYICSIVGLKQLCLAKTDITELPPQIGNLPFLEGLDVEGTQITKLPPQIGKLQHLKTLDARKSRVKELPHQVVRLTGLVHLLIGDNESSEGVKLPDGIGKMTSLQQLCTIDLRKCSVSSLKELGELPDLKYIAVVSSDEPEDTRINTALLSSLEKSTKLRSLVVYSDFRLSMLQSSTPYNLNCQKKLTVLRRSLKVPTCIADCFLGMLDIRVCKLEEDDLRILRELPRLQSLVVRLEVLPTKMIRISCEGFAKLESFYVDCRMPRIIFDEEAMLKLEHLEFKLYGGSASEEHMDIKHLLRLQKVTIRYSKWYATNKGVERTTDAIKTEAKEHQNKGIEETTDVVKTAAKEHQKKGIKEIIGAVKTEAKEHQNKITLCVAEEDKDGKCIMRTEVFKENIDSSCSRMTKMEEEGGHADGTGYFLKGRDTREGDLHQSIHGMASCRGTSEIEEVAE